ncbi:Hypothetical predicted protein [Mytilus galloprovincialis]|uniref:Death domain-containing protein n=1 Tax=Mytilus galloprovincialis TaxID=29158 RepID=A0A8B6HUS8_MYTGA|nr:Hypothetical predicted protein [Mytilus galloprovincialis]
MICLGIDTTELKTVPSNKHLVRLASIFEISAFREFIVRLGLDVQEYSNIQNQYESNGVQSIMFMALDRWMKDIRAKLKQPCFKHIRDAMLEVNMNHHFLCQVFREDTSLNDVSERRLQMLIEDDVLADLPKYIGNCVIHLGIELGLTVEEIEVAMFNNPKDMYSQLAFVLHMWKTQSKRPTIFALMKALQHVKSGGLSYLCKQYNISI